MNRMAQACVMIFFGAAVLRASVTDLYLRYVKEGLRPFLIAASLLLIVAAVMTLWYELRPHTDALEDGSNPNDHAGENGRNSAEQSTSVSTADELHDEHSHHELRVAWLLLLPALGLLLVTPPALGSYAAGQAGTALTAEQDYDYDYPPLPAGDPATTTVFDYASRALFDKGQSIGNRRVQLTGFITPGPDGQPILARMILSCCAADGRPVKLGMAGNAPTDLADDTWVQVTGRYTDRVTRDSINDEEIPYIDVESWRQVTAPKDPYE
ncbi:TIGR03943 family putative permease subunit [Micromonospora foliorum]|uniref:TIGR03943 family putative permease subunit n=1 Tax=Micromonospora foliorum TaxID=2911210 RepID=UPI001EE9753B|nr:TIGR03943 family protein [Micromonospora foliorum]MCG5436657.1 TIGR03943 family protein [Micromonospora foliorum]